MVKVLAVVDWLMDDIVGHKVYKSYTSEQCLTYLNFVQ